MAIIVPISFAFDDVLFYNIRHSWIDSF